MPCWIIAAEFEKNCSLVYPLEKSYHKPAEIRGAMEAFAKEFWTMLRKILHVRETIGVCQITIAIMPPSRQLASSYVTKSRDLVTDGAVDSNDVLHKRVYMRTCPWVLWISFLLFVFGKDREGNTFWATSLSASATRSVLPICFS